MELIGFVGGCFLLVCILVEAYYLRTGQHTISRRVQVWGRENFQIWTALVGLLAALAGWLLAHFSSPPA